MATFQAQVEAEPPIVAWPKSVFSAKRCTSNRSFGNSFCRANADFDGIQLSYPTAIHSVRIDVDVFWKTSSLYPSGSVLWQQEVKAFLKGLRLGEKWKLDTKPMVQMVSNNVQRTKVNQVLLLWTHSGYAFYCLRKDIPFPFRTSTKPEMITSSECSVQIHAELLTYYRYNPTSFRCLFSYSSNRLTGAGMCYNISLKSSTSEWRLNLSSIIQHRMARFGILELPRKISGYCPRICFCWKI